MKTLIFFRHAKAEDKTISGKDFDRHLTERGIEDARKMGIYMKKHKIKTDLLLTSPAYRAAETALIVNKEFSENKIKLLVNEDLYKADVDDYLEIIHELDEKLQSCMIFGHNPSITETANFLCENFRENIGKSAAVAVKFEISNWTEVKKGKGKFIFFTSPKLL